MRMTALGAGLGLVALLLLTLFSGLRGEALAQRPAVPGAADGLIAFTSPVSEKIQLLTVVDPHQHVVSVYHIDTHTGEIGLKSVRNIHWDLQMTEFNGVSPLPREIRALAEQR